MNLTFTIPDAVAVELNQVASSEGFTNAKAMVIHWLKAKLETGRKRVAAKQAEAVVDTTDLANIK